MIGFVPTVLILRFVERRSKMAHTPTPAQKQAIITIDRDVAVLAGAGSGKTRVLVDRYLYLLSQGVRINQILAITFTRKAALEMKERIRNGIASSKSLSPHLLAEFGTAHISTIHGFCQRLVADHPCQAEIDPHFQIAEEWESRGLLYQVTEELLGIAIARQEAGIVEIRESVRQSAQLVDDIVDTYERVTSKGEKNFQVEDESQILTSQIDDLRQELIEDLSAWLNEIETKKLSASKEVVVYDINHAFKEYLLSYSDPNYDQQGALDELAKLFGGNWAKDLKPQVSEFKHMCEQLSQLLIDRDANRILIHLGELITDIDQEYQNRKRVAGLLDYNDLEQLAVKLLSDTNLDPSYHFQHVMVDEAQDINPVQKQIIELLTQNPNTKLFVVGDPKQSIYRFRGAQVEVFLDLQEQVVAEGGKHITLGDNFRSRPHLIEFGNQFFSQLFDKDPISFTAANPRREQPQHKLIDFIFTDKEKDLGENRTNEAAKIASYVNQLVEREGFRYQDITILLSVMSNVRIYERALNDHQIPFVNLSGRGFYQKPEIQDILHFLKWLQDSSDEISMISVLRSPFFAVSDEGLYWLQSGKLDQLSDADRQKLDTAYNRYPMFQEEFVLQPAPHFLEYLLAETEFSQNTLNLEMGKQRWANIMKFKNISWQLWSKGYVSFKEQLNYIDQLVEHLGREGEANLDNEISDVVTIMTIHGSKGLEFPVVIVPDLSRSIIRPEMGILHYHSDFGLTLRNTTKHKMIKEVLRSESIAEAKRLLYVAITRAEEKLALAGIGSFEDYNLNQPFESMRTWWEWFLAGINFVDPKLFQAVAIDETADKADYQIAASKDGKVFAPPELIVQNKYSFSSFSATSLMIYAQCPRQYYYRYILRVPEISTARPKTLTLSKLDPLKRGNIVHRVCEHIKIGANHEELLDWAIQMEQIKVTASERRELLGYVNRYLASDFYREHSKYRVDKEVEFGEPLAQFLITGTIDQVIYSESGLKIIDLKTNHITHEQIDETAQSYTWQLRIYAWALQQKLAKPISGTGLYFLFPDVIYYSPEASDIAGTQEWLLEACNRIQVGANQGVEAFPAVADCRYCPYDCQNISGNQSSFEKILAGLGKLESK